MKEIINWLSGLSILQSKTVYSGIPTRPMTESVKNLGRLGRPGRANFTPSREFAQAYANKWKIGTGEVLTMRVPRKFLKKGGMGTSLMNIPLYYSTESIPQQLLEEIATLNTIYNIGLVFDGGSYIDPVYIAQNALQERLWRFLRVMDILGDCINPIDIETGFTS